MIEYSKVPFSGSSEWKREAFASAWYEKVIIPAYGIGKPEKNPMFLENRVYQGQHYWLLQKSQRKR